MAETIWTRAHAALVEAAKDGRLRMSIPARPEHDHDLLIGAAIDAGEQASAKVAELEREARRFYRADGTFEELSSAAEVVERRKAAAVHIADLGRYLEQRQAQVVDLERRLAEAQKEAALRVQQIGEHKEFIARLYVAAGLDQPDSMDEAVNAVAALRAQLSERTRELEEIRDTDVSWSEAVERYRESAESAEQRATAADKSARYEALRSADLQAQAKRYREALATALPYVEQEAEGESYGAFPGGDPRDFKPDLQCSTEEERKRWRDDCELAAKGALPGGVQQAHVMDSRGHVARDGFYGLGTYPLRDEEAVKLRDAIRALAASPSTETTDQPAIPSLASPNTPREGTDSAPSGAETQTRVAANAVSVSPLPPVSTPPPRGAQEGGSATAAAEPPAPVPPSPQEGGRCRACGGSGYTLAGNALTSAMLPCPACHPAAPPSPAEPGATAFALEVRAAVADYLDQVVVDAIDVTPAGRLVGRLMKSLDAAGVSRPTWLGHDRPTIRVSDLAGPKGKLPDQPPAPAPEPGARTPETLRSLLLRALAIGCPDTLHACIDSLAAEPGAREGQGAGKCKTCRGSGVGGPDGQRCLDCAGAGAKEGADEEGEGADEKCKCGHPKWSHEDGDVLNDTRCRACYPKGKCSAFRPAGAGKDGGK